MGSINQRLIKLKQGQKTAFPFPLMVSPLHTSSLNPYSLPFFIPQHFACRRRPNPVHLFAPVSIAMFSGLGFNPFFYLLFFGKFKSDFIYKYVHETTLLDVFGGNFVYRRTAFLQTNPKLHTQQKTPEHFRTKCSGIFVSSSSLTAQRLPRPQQERPWEALQLLRRSVRACW